MTDQPNTAAPSMTLPSLETVTQYAIVFPFFFGVVDAMPSCKRPLPAPDTMLAFALPLVFTSMLTCVTRLLAFAKRRPCCSYWSCLYGDATPTDVHTHKASRLVAALSFIALSVARGTCMQ